MNLAETLNSENRDVCKHGLHCCISCGVRKVPSWKWEAIPEEKRQEALERAKR